MRLEVTAGQYLDILEENAWSTHPDDEQLARAERVIVFKSAKYSVEAPLAIGALLAGGTAGQVDALRRFGLPLGIAYQLRDDLLGVFGDADVTGKPSGDDLREGKRTVLIALARAALDESSVRTLDGLLGDPRLDDGQVEWLQQTIAGSGAVQRVEQRIAENVRLAVAAIEAGPIDADSRQQLSALADAVTRRSA
jgi:geranylgeranyl diphosphate synthase type I